MRQFLHDEKGITLIAVFGVPPFSHQDDAVRGISAAINIHSHLKVLLINFFFFFNNEFTFFNRL